MTTDREFEKQSRLQEWLDTQVFPYRAVLLIFGLGGGAFHINGGYLVFAFVAYWFGDYLERAAKIRRLNATHAEVEEEHISWDEEMSEKDPPAGLPREHRVVVNQVAEFLRRMLCS